MDGTRERDRQKDEWLGTTNRQYLKKTKDTKVSSDLMNEWTLVRINI
jgi:hypothetical protein